MYKLSNSIGEQASISDGEREKWGEKHCLYNAGSGYAFFFFLLLFLFLLLLFQNVEQSSLNWLVE